MKNRVFVLLFLFVGTLLCTARAASSDTLYVPKALGIGVQHPQVALHINGSVRGNVGSYGALRIQSSAGYVEIGPKNNTMANIDTDRSRFMFNKPVYTTNGTFGAQGALRLTANGWNGLTMLGSQKVGIGTSNPAYTLDVYGTMRAQEIFVNMDTIPDFVFEDTYPLLPLDSVATYINANKHLPGIPSAQEMEASSVSVNTMQKQLLQKIEELTLYIIQLQNEIEILKQR